MLADAGYGIDAAFRAALTRMALAAPNELPKERHAKTSQFLHDRVTGNGTLVLSDCLCFQAGRAMAFGLAGWR